MGSAPRRPPAAARELLPLLALVAALPAARGDCGPLPRLNGAVPDNKTGSFPVGTQVTYRCRDGFVKIPGRSDTVTCLRESEWQRFEEFCGRSCSVPPRLMTAVLIDQDSSKSYYPPGTTVNYVCRPGYKNKEPTHQLTCREDATWPNPPDFCSKKSCRPPELENGRAVDRNYEYGASVKIVCNEGFALENGNLIHCILKEGQLVWSKLPVCKRSCSVPPQLRTAVLIDQDSSKSYYPPGTTVSYVCRPGYENKEPTHQLTCREDATWPDPPDFCSKKSCRPPELENGRAVDRNYEYGASVKIVCNEGFTLENGNLIHCILKEDQLVWSKLPVCKPTITSPPPPDTTSGRHNGPMKTEKHDDNPPVHRDAVEPDATATITSPPPPDITSGRHKHLMETEKHDDNPPVHRDAVEPDATATITSPPPPDITSGRHKHLMETEKHDDNPPVHRDAVEPDATATITSPPPSPDITSGRHKHLMETEKHDDNPPVHRDAVEPDATATITSPPPPDITSGRHKHLMETEKHDDNPPVHRDAVEPDATEPALEEPGSFSEHHDEAGSSNWYAILGGCVGVVGVVVVLLAAVYIAYRECCRNGKGSYSVNGDSEKQMMQENGCLLNGTDVHV